MKYFFLYFFKYFSIVKLICSIPYESKYIIVSFEDDIPMKCVPFSFSFDKLTIIENFSSLNVGILSIENVPIPNSSTQARGNTSGLRVVCVFWKMRGLITRLSGCSWSGQAFTSWSRRPSDRICPISSASCTHGRTWPRLKWGRRSSHLACTGKILYSSSHFYFFPFLFGTLNFIMICLTLISFVFRKYLKVLPNNSMDLC